MTIKNPISFNWETRSVLSLLFMGYRDHKEIGRALSCAPKHLKSLEKFIYRILSSNNRVITTCLRYGMPATCTVEIPLPNTVRCRTCGSDVFVVPCVTCAASSWKPGLLGTHLKPSEPSFPTSAQPGSPEKIEIMRQRVSRGESPFHTDDAIKLR